MCLGGIVGRPILLVGDPHRLGDDGGAIGAVFPTHDELYGPDVLATLVAGFKVWAGAIRFIAIQIDDVGAIARLGRDFPSQGILGDLSQRSYLKSLFLSSIHLSDPPCFDVHIVPYNVCSCQGQNITGTSDAGSLTLHTMYGSMQSMLDEGPELEEPELNKVQQALANLEGLGWTLAAIADELTVTQNAVQKWKAGQRTPRPLKPTLVLLESLARRKGVPKKRRYEPGSRSRRMAEAS